MPGSRMSFCIRLIILLSCLCFSVIFLCGFLLELNGFLLAMHIRDIRWYKDTHFLSGCTLPMSPEELTTVRQILHVAVHVLASHGAHAAICHGTLWGAMRRGDLLPWDPNPDLCILNTELHRKQSKRQKENPAFRALREKHFHVSSFDQWNGIYYLSYTPKDSKVVTIKLRVFSDCTDYYYKRHMHQYRLEVHPGVLNIKPHWVCPDSWFF
ncbi:hypothetical protein EGW08_008642 [Elysia chlorotica]|uniref:LicD/FKTN/FKRP nucleotidyltransferase domain-containing protein n=1 Tax=Elysia chlorotica TaxID=188477 RepID=A0A3S1BAA9_ELYCH|nr:hypothetical protein EGW08_008642 [Elysia chlorotica]